MTHIEIIRGDLSATLYLGDCLNIAPLMQDVEVIITDPPYGMNWNADTTRFSGGDPWSSHNRGNGKSQAGVLHDDEPFDPAPWLDYSTVVLFGCNHFSARLPVGTTLIWLKKHDSAYGTFLSDAELAWMKGGCGVYAKRDTTEQGGDRQNHGRTHPTQKPVSIMAWCMERAGVKKGATVLDPYMGSGTTGVACLRTGRNFIGIEIDQKHFANAVARLQREAMQGLLL